MENAEFETLKDKIVVAERLVRHYQEEYRAETGIRFVSSGPREAKALLSASKELIKELWRVTV